MSDPQQYISELISDARVVIRKDLYDKLFKLSTYLEDYMVVNKIPIDPTYTEDTYYTLECYPQTNYRDFYNNLKNKVAPEMESKFGITGLLVKFDVENYRSGMYYGPHTLLTFYNVYYPKNNTKYSFDTYKDLSRYDPNDNTNTMVKYIVEFTGGSEKRQMVDYIHPKYILEQTLRLSYSPIDDVDIDSEINAWKGISSGDFDKIIYPGKVESNIVIPEQIKKLIQFIHIDNNLTGLISTHDTTHIVDTLIQSNSGSKSYDNSAKTFYDPRLTNVIIKDKEGNVLIKLWNILDYELIPVIKYNKKVHINVLLRISLAEYISYNMVGSNIAGIKLGLFMGLLEKRRKLIDKKILADITKCEFIGTNRNLDDYKKEQRHLFMANQFKKYSK